MLVIQGLCQPVLLLQSSSASRCQRCGENYPCPPAYDLQSGRIFNTDISSLHNLISLAWYNSKKGLYNIHTTNFVGVNLGLPSIKAYLVQLIPVVFEEVCFCQLIGPTPSRNVNHQQNPTNNSKSAGFLVLHAQNVLSRKGPISKSTYHGWQEEDDVQSQSCKEGAEAYALQRHAEHECKKPSQDILASIYGIVHGTMPGVQMQSRWSRRSQQGLQY